MHFTSSLFVAIVSAGLVSQALAGPTLIERKKGGKISFSFKKTSKVGKVYDKAQTVYDAAGLLSNTTTVTLWARPDYTTFGVDGLTFIDFTTAPLGTQEIPGATFSWVNATGTATVDGQQVATNEFFLSSDSKFIDVVYKVNPDGTLATDDPLDTLYCKMDTLDWFDDGSGDKDGDCVLSHRVGGGAPPLIKAAGVTDLLQVDYEAVRIVNAEMLPGILSTLWNTPVPTVPADAA